MTSSRAVASIALALLPLLTACGGQDATSVTGSGRLVSEDRAVEAAFHGVRIAGVGDVEVTQGDEARVSVQADDNVIDLVTTHVEDGILVVGPGGLSLSRATVAVRVTTPDVDLLAIDGAGRIRTAGPLRSGALTVRIAGAGDVTVSGAADALRVELTGAGDVRAFDLAAAQCTVELGGAGNVEVTATEALSVLLSGAGNVVYDGHPASVQQSVTGLGSVRAR